MLYAALFKAFFHLWYHHGLYPPSQIEKMVYPPALQLEDSRVNLDLSLVVLDVGAVIAGSDESGVRYHAEKELIRLEPLSCMRSLRFDTSSHNPY